MKTDSQIRAWRQGKCASGAIVLYFVIQRYSLLETIAISVAALGVEIVVSLAFESFYRHRTATPLDGSRE